MNDQEAAKTDNAKAEAPSDQPLIDPKQTHQIAEYKHDRALTTCQLDPQGRFLFRCRGLATLSLEPRIGREDRLNRAPQLGPVDSFFS